MTSCLLASCLPASYLLRATAEHSFWDWPGGSQAAFAPPHSTHHCRRAGVEVAVEGSPSWWSHPSSGQVVGSDVPPCRLVGWLVGWLAGWLVGWLVVGWLVGWLVGSKSKGQIGALQQAATTASNHGIAETPTWSLQDPYLSKRPKQLYAACSSLIHSFQNNRARRTSSCANKAIGM